MPDSILAPNVKNETLPNRQGETNGAPLPMSQRISMSRNKNDSALLSFGSEDREYVQDPTDEREVEEDEKESSPVVAVAAPFALQPRQLPNRGSDMELSNSAERQLVQTNQELEVQIKELRNELDQLQKRADMKNEELVSTAHSKVMLLKEEFNQLNHAVDKAEIEKGALSLKVGSTVAELERKDVELAELGKRLNLVEAEKQKAQRERIDSQEDYRKLKAELDQVRTQMLHEREEFARISQSERGALEGKLEEMCRARHDTEAQRKVLETSLAMTVQEKESIEKQLRAKLEENQAMSVKEKNALACQADMKQHSLQIELDTLRQALKDAVSEREELCRAHAERTHDLQEELNDLHLELNNARDEQARKADDEHRLFREEIDQLRRVSEETCAEKKIIAEEYSQAVGLLKLKEQELAKITKQSESNYQEKEKLLFEVKQLRAEMFAEQQAQTSRVRALEEELEQMREANDKICSEKVILADKNSEHSKLLESTKKELAETAKRVDSISKEKQSILAEMTEVQTQLTTVQKEGEMKLQSVEEKIAQLRQLNDDLSERHAQTIEEFQSKKEEAAHLQECLDAKINEHASLLSQSAEIQAKIIKGKDEQIAVAKNERYTLREKIEKMRGKLRESEAEAEAEKEALTEKFCDAVRLVESKDVALHHANEHLNSVRSNHSLLLVELDEVKTRLTKEKDEQIAKAEDEMSGLRNEIENLRRDKQEAKTEKETKSRSFSEASRKLQSKNLELGIATGRVGELLAELARLEERAIEKQEHENEVEAECSKLREELNQWREVKMEIENEKKRLIEKHQDSESTVQNLRVEMEEMCSQMIKEKIDQSRDFETERQLLQKELDLVLQNNDKNLVEKEKLAREQTEIQQELQARKLELSETCEKLAEITQRLESVHIEHRQQSQQQISNHRLETKLLEEDLERTRNDLLSAQQALADSAEVKDRMDTLQTLYERLQAEMVSAEDGHRRLLAEAQASMMELEAKLADVHTALKLKDVKIHAVQEDFETRTDELTKENELKVAILEREFEETCQRLQSAQTALNVERQNITQDRAIAYRLTEEKSAEKEDNPLPLNVQRDVQFTQPFAVAGSLDLNAEVRCFCEVGILKSEKDEISECLSKTGDAADGQVTKATVFFSCPTGDPGDDKKPIDDVKIESEMCLPRNVSLHSAVGNKFQSSHLVADDSQPITEQSKGTELCDSIARDEESSNAGCSSLPNENKIACVAPRSITLADHESSDEFEERSCFWLIPKTTPDDGADKSTSDMDDAPCYWGFMNHHPNIASDAKNNTPRTENGKSLEDSHTPIVNENEDGKPLKDSHESIGVVNENEDGKSLKDSQEPIVNENQDRDTLDTKSAESEKLHKRDEEHGGPFDREVELAKEQPHEEMIEQKSSPPCFFFGALFRPKEPLLI
mmetsp:Transcript_13906/g.28055  ORF Transcript_13906/g.28055 Transcript_13906/m.28055 type:complete len:1418 (+) Transcript_13906:234-4487(+)